jgi:hypothetical protein
MGFADDLRALGSDELAQLLMARPELAEPAPTTMNELANRASAPYSVQRIVSTLNTFSLRILHGLAMFGAPVSAASIAALARDEPPVLAISNELYRLRTLGLVTMRHEEWAIPAPVSRMIGRPFNLGERLEHCFDRHGASELRVIAENLGLTPVVGKVGLIRQITDKLINPEQLVAVLRMLPEPTRALLGNTVADGNSIIALPGLMQRSRVPLEAAQLLSYGLLVPLDWDLAEIPREVSLVLLGGRPIASFDVAPPPLSGNGPKAPDDRIDPPALTDLVARLLYRWAEEPVALLKSGGVGVTVLKTVAKELGVPTTTAAVTIALAGMAQLVVADLYRSEAIVTPKGKEWLTLQGAHKWLSLVDGWRCANYDLFPFAAHEDAPPPLRVDTMSLDAPWRRGRLLAALGAATYVGEPDPVSLQAHLLWEGPARWNVLEMTPTAMVEGLLADLRRLGLLVDGKLTPAAHALVKGDSLSVLQRAADGFPQPIDSFTVQGDLTAIAPGELRADVSAELAMLADVESRGGATMLRFSETSLRRAMDRGRSGPTIMSFLERHARPTVPQTLRVLIEDVARRHGALRTGSAVSYLRTEDPALLAGAVNHRKLAKAKLRLLAPTVAVSELEAPKLLKLLREAGFAPMPEDAGGELLSLSADGASRRSFPAPRNDRLALEAERAWSYGVAGGDVRSLIPTVAISKLADRLRAGHR